MTRRAQRYANRIAAGRARGGDRRGVVTFRHITTQPGIDPAPNPPRVANLVVNGTPTYTSNPALPYNKAANPWADGAAIGVSLPTEWGQIAGGLTAAVSAITDNVDGTRTVEFTISGTSNGNPQNLRFTEDATLPIINAAVPGDIWSVDVGFELVSLSAGQARVWLNSISSSGSIINSNAIQSAVVAPGSPYGRYRLSGALTNASTAGAVGTIRIEGLTNGVAVNAVFRVTYPVLTPGSAYLTDTVSIATLAARRGGIQLYGAIGPSALSVRGNPLVGSFIAGDSFAARNAIGVVANAAIANGGIAALQLAAPLGDVLIDGDAITPTWVNETQLTVEISGLGERVPDGRLIQARDLFLVVPAGSLPWKPANGDRVTLPSGDIREVVSIVPVYVDGIPIAYRMQVR